MSQKKRVKELIAKVGLSKVANKKMKKIIWRYEAQGRNCTGYVEQPEDSDT